MLQLLLPKPNAVFAYNRLVIRVDGAQAKTQASRGLVRPDGRVRGVFTHFDARTRKEFCEKIMAWRQRRRRREAFSTQRDDSVFDADACGLVGVR